MRLKYSSFIAQWGCELAAAPMLLISSAQQHTACLILQAKERGGNNMEKRTLCLFMI
jgi:hypothetical protein